MSTTTLPWTFGDHLRFWRQQRRLSQLELAADAAVSTRHLSFVETGRSLPSREMVLRLAQRLEVPLRERNALLVAAGYAPMYRLRPLDDPGLAAARQAVELVLRGHEPFPALAVDRHWNLISYNAPIGKLMRGVSPALLRPPVNVLRMSLHSQGLAPQIRNLPHWRAHVFARLRQQIDATADASLQALLDELRGHASQQENAEAEAVPDAAGLVVSLQLDTPHGLLNLISTTTVFGSPVDVTLQELALESFFPADAATAAALHALADLD